MMELRIRVNKIVEKGSDFGHTTSSTFLQKKGSVFHDFDIKGVDFEQRSSPIRGLILDLWLPDRSHVASS